MISFNCIGLRGVFAHLFAGTLFYVIGIDWQLVPLIKSLSTYFCQILLFCSFESAMPGGVD